MEEELKVEMGRSPQLRRTSTVILALVENVCWMALKPLVEEEGGG